MKVVYYAYRDWAIDIFKKVEFDDAILVTTKDYNIIKQLNPDVVFFVGWSFIVPDDIVFNYDCICLHPSRLPEYRGGSPIQHQLINDEQVGAVTLFEMDEGIDTGDILVQFNFGLKGNIKEILENLVTIGTYSIGHLVDHYHILKKEKRKQDESKATIFKRRKPSESEITLEEIQNSTPTELYNKIRGLTDPYPNAFIRCKDGKKLYILESKDEK
jgi:methionyl-tRNA formyltransferase